MIRRIGVLGAGAWGLTLADLLAKKGELVTVWDRNAEVLRALARDRTRNSPVGLVVDESITFEPDLQALASVADVLVCAVPSYAIRALCERLRDVWSNGRRRIFVSCSKGIEENTLMLPSQIFTDVMGKKAAHDFVVLAGPSHAEEVCRGVPTLVVCCAAEPEIANLVRDLFFRPTFRVYTQGDCKGVELGGALKNVLAIAAGGCDGLGFGDNTKAALVTRGLAELSRAAIALGAERQTLMGLSGLGDLVVTCGSQHSRNRKFGELIARGLTPEQALDTIGAAVEGYRTAKSAHALAANIGVEMPIAATVYRILYEGISVNDALRALLERDPRPENY
ncbi:MAG: NAD(P)H-dependent glycerol-3-phosphate dehydrogenase [Candidatus Sumerlaeaceae bacterium]